MLDLDDTIAAIASPPGGALRGIVRLSGPASVACAERLFAAEGDIHLATIRQATCLPGSLTIGDRWGAIPARLYVWPSTQSYTRQPSVELHTIGSPPLLEAVLEAAILAGARLARPGEFTLRAHLAGRLDLTQAEAVLGVIDARSQRELALALEQLSGGLAEPLAGLRSTLLDLLAHLEAGLDFADEDIEFIARDELDRQLQAAVTLITRLAQQMQSRREAAELPRVVLWGEPNVGKSSLMNALSGSAVALVSDRAGTTRDYVTKMLSLDGIQCLLVDTAGATNDSFDPIAAAAQQATDRSTAAAEVTLLCLDASRPPSAWEFAQRHNRSAPPPILVLTKCDLPPARAAQPGEIATSSTSGAGLSELRQVIARQLHRSHGESALVGTAVRCRESLQQAGDALARARRSVVQGDGEELVAAELRLALDGLGQVAGVVYTEDVLDRVFSRFCIGK
jgi:tRNA modification GTPase